MSSTDESGSRRCFGRMGRKVFATFCMSDSNTTTVILLVGHGTREETGTQQFLELVEVLKERLAPAAVEAAFLELREPGIEVGVERLLGQEIERLVTVPLLL